MGSHHSIVWELLYRVGGGIKYIIFMNAMTVSQSDRCAQIMLYIVEKHITLHWSISLFLIGISINIIILVNPRAS